MNHQQQQGSVEGVLPPATSAATTILVPDYQTAEYRGFVFVRHIQHGLVLLHCTRKKSKGPHWQTPGGRIDEVEFQAAGMCA
jgi:phage-related protein